MIFETKRQLLEFFIILQTAKNNRDNAVKTSSF